MTAPPPDAPVRLRLKCPDAEDFVERFAPNVTRAGIFLPTREVRAVGSPIRFEIALADGTVVLAGEGSVTWAKPKGLGVKFTTLDPASARIVERLLGRRQASPASPPAAPPRADPAPEPQRPAPATRAVAPAEPSLSPPPIERGTTRSLGRIALASSAVVVGIAVVWMSVSRARGAGASAPPGNPAGATPVATESAGRPIPPPASSDAPVAPPPASVPPPRPDDARAEGLRVESVLVGASYEKFTCPHPTTRLSVKSSHTVNVCLQVAHKPGKSERLALVWERDGAFTSKTTLTIPASKPNVRTRARMKISANRLGAWSVRVMSDRNASLAQATFRVVP
jgi:hypothetical protein